MNKKLFIALLTILNTSLFAMEQQSFYLAIRANNISELQKFIKEGIELNPTEGVLLTPLMHAMVENKSEIVELLLKNGARVDFKSINGMNALHWSAQSRSFNQDIILKVLTYIPSDEQDKIKGYMAALISIKRRKGLYPDARRLITRELINKLVDQQMIRIINLLKQKTNAQRTANQIALSKNRIPGLLNPNDPKTIKTLRAALRKEIWNVLIGPPQAAK